MWSESTFHRLEGTMTISILHLSDLHRDILEEPDSDSLLYSLERDFATFPTSSPPIFRPNVCVVSGDLISGSKKKGNDAYSDIKSQYEQTQKFLIEIANLFFHGDRKRIVIIPGNHDVCLEQVNECIEKIHQPTDPIEIKKLKCLAYTQDSNIRWSWDDLSFYKIIDKDKYKQRFSFFSEMYKSFYLGEREYSLEPSEQWDIFDFPDLCASIGTINTCHNNDQFRQSGEVHPGALSNLCRAMKAPKRKGWFLAATWHHNISGPPTREDYVSSSFLPILIETDIGLGMHGHQHSPDCFDEQHRYGPNKNKITIIAASTLCSGAHHLQSGTPRSYNIIEIDLDKKSGRVHQRAMVGEDIKHPAWIPGKFLQTQNSFVDFSPVLPREIRPHGLDLNIALGNAEKALSQQKWEEVVDLLVEHKHNGTARVFLTKALEHSDDNQSIIDILSPPSTTSEAILIGGAIEAIWNKDYAKQFLKYPIVENSIDASIKHIKRIIERIK